MSTIENDGMSTTTYPHLTEPERNALRGFLQRGEVRLSTMHRIAIAFISGAGLLLLMPVFFKDAIDAIIQVMLLEAENVYPHLGALGVILSFALYLAIGYPLLLSLFIPIYAVMLLLKDITHFYFTVYMPGFSSKLLNPTLSVSPLAFPYDDSQRVKEAIIRYQYSEDRFHYMIPFSEEKRRQYFDSLINSTNGDIVPATRHVDDLIAQGILPEDINRDEARRLSVAFGVARVLDRTLIEEAANLEMTLARSTLYLRRLLLRYLKALLMFIWTMGVSFMMLPFMTDDRLPIFILLAAGYLMWSVGVMRLMRLPLHWIYRHRRGDPSPKHIDPQLTLMEDIVGKYCRWAIGVSLLALLLATGSYL